MKAESFCLINKNVRNNAIMRINELECNGKLKITISNSGSKSGKQRSLNWKWNDEVARSGKGGKHEDTKTGVHMVAKYRWAIPILQRDDPLFADLYGLWVKLYGKNQERMLWFVSEQVHTENMTVHQVAEFLTDFQRYYSGLGIELTNPDDKGLLEFEGANK